MFVHYTGIVRVRDGRRNLFAGQRVAFDLAYNNKGAIAVNVIVLSPETAPRRVSTSHVRATGEGHLEESQF